jgi:hypothetical protein
VTTRSYRLARTVTTYEYTTVTAASLADARRQADRRGPGKVHRVGATQWKELAAAAPMGAGKPNQEATQ